MINSLQETDRVDNTVLTGAAQQAEVARRLDWLSEERWTYQGRGSAKVGVQSSEEEKIARSLLQNQVRFAERQDGVAD